MTYIYIYNMLAWVRRSHCHCQDLLVRPAPDLSGPFFGSGGQVSALSALGKWLCLGKGSLKTIENWWLVNCWYTDILVGGLEHEFYELIYWYHWLVVWNMNFMNCWYTDILVGGEWNHGILNDFPCIGNNHPNWRTHIFQRGWNHQLVHVCDEFGTCWNAKVWETKLAVTMKYGSKSLL